MREAMKAALRSSGLCPSLGLSWQGMKWPSHLCVLVLQGRMEPWFGSVPAADQELHNLHPHTSRYRCRADGCEHNPQKPIRLSPKIQAKINS